ncbi:MAG: helix-turn-helix domain-containing protein, partial [Dehalococcoidia bacterium]
MQRARPAEPRAPTAVDRSRWSTVLQALREARGVTQEGWAARLGVSLRTVQRWERGERVPDPGAEAGILAYCSERGLFRTYDRGPLAGLSLTAESLQALIAEARLTTGARAGADLPSAPLDQHSNLPAQTSSFVGREQELAALRRVLGATRLLTLIGAGGCGKTRLALRVADELLWAYPHGVWFVELAALADPALVPETVAAALDVRTTGAQPVTSVLVEHLARRHLLLILDNCEHLLPTCGVLVETLLRACPHLEVMLTSREPLRITGETVWRAPPLSPPDAACLFVERARQNQPPIDLTAANGAAIDEICRRLDGIPLAIELAAARVRALSIEQIAERLDDRFRLLITGSRTALPRQQTLRGTLDWSYDLLTDVEQAMLRRLSVFAGGFMLDAAETVCTDLPSQSPSLTGKEESDATNAAGTSHGSNEPIPMQPSFDRSPPSLRGKGAGGLGIDTLTYLVDKSLVVAHQRAGAVRYGLLETVRRYAGEKLESAGEALAARRRHRGWCLALAERAEPELLGPGQA